MGSFNAFVQKKREIGASKPIWLGDVSPRPVGGVLASDWCTEGRLIPAGAPVQLASGVITPFVAWEVASVDTTNHKLTIKASTQYADVLPVANDFLSPVGATFDATGAAGKVSAITADTTEGQYVVTMTDSKLDSVSVGSYVAYSSATAVAASGKSLACQPNGYLYNDIYIDNLLEGEEFVSKSASGAVIDFHGEGLLIDRTNGYAFKAMLKVAIPHVSQVEF